MAKRRPKISVKVTGFKAFEKRLKAITSLDVKKVTQREMTQIWRDAGEAFIRTAVRNTLVESGMSAASFFPLSRAIKRITVLRPFIEKKIKTPTGSSPRLKRKGIAEFPTGRRVPGRPSPREGEARGENAFTFDIGTVQRMNFAFRFQTNVFQQAFHEASRDTIGKGRSAFLYSVEQSLRPAIRLILTSWLKGRKPRGRGTKIEPITGERT